MTWSTTTTPRRAASASSRRTTSGGRSTVIGMPQQVYDDIAAPGPPNRLADRPPADSTTMGGLGVVGAPRCSPAAIVEVDADLLGFVGEALAGRGARPSGQSHGAGAGTPGGIEERFGLLQELDRRSRPRRRAGEAHRVEATP